MHFQSIFGTCHSKAMRSLKKFWKVLECLEKWFSVVNSPCGSNTFPITLAYLQWKLVSFLIWRRCKICSYSINLFRSRLDNAQMEGDSIERCKNWIKAKTSCWGKQNKRRQNGIQKEQLRKKLENKQVKVMLYDEKYGSMCITNMINSEWPWNNVRRIGTMQRRIIP